MLDPAERAVLRIAGKNERRGGPAGGAERWKFTHQLPGGPVWLGAEA